MTSKQYIQFAVNEMKKQPDNIKRWSQQNDNPLLKKIASEVIEIAKIHSYEV